jgi:uncharacterized membrane protein
VTFFAILAVAFGATWLLPERLGGRSLKTAARRAMGVAFIVAGVTHLLMPDSFLAHFPDWTPYPTVLNALSGIAEIVGGLALLLTRGRALRAVGMLLALYLVLVFPANVYVAVADVDVPGLPDVWWYAWARLPFQALFVWWVARSTSLEGTRVDQSLIRPRPRLAKV